MYLCLLIWSTSFSTVCRCIVNASTIGCISSLPLLKQSLHLVAEQSGFCGARALGDDRRKGEESHRRVETLMRALEITSDQLLVKGSYGDIVAAG